MLTLAEVPMDVLNLFAEILQENRSMIDDASRKNRQPKPGISPG